MLRFPRIIMRDREYYDIIAARYEVIIIMYHTAKLYVDKELSSVECAEMIVRELFYK